MKRKMLLAGVVTLSAALFLNGCSQGAPQKSAPEVLKEGLKKLSMVTSYRFESNIKVDINGPKDNPPEKVKGEIKLSGGADAKDKQDPKFDLNFDISGNADVQAVAAAGQVILNKGVLYANLAKLVLPEGSGSSMDLLNIYINKWWKFTLPENVKKELSMNLTKSDDASLTAKQKEIKDLFLNTDFLSNPTFVAVESVKGESSYHYRVNLNNKAMVEFVKKVAVLEEKPISEAEVKEAEAALAKLLISGDVWVGVTSGMLNQMSMEIKMNGNTDGAVPDPSGTISFSITFFDLDKPLTLVEPKDATEFPIESILGPLLGGGFGGDDTTPVTPEKLKLDLSSQELKELSFPE